MILQEKFWKEELGQIEKHPFNYLLLKTKHFQYCQEKEIFTQGIELMNLYNIIRMINRFFSEAGIQENLDASILNKVTGSIFTEEPFTEEQLKEYFTFSRKLENIAGAMTSLAPDAMEYTFVPVKVLMVLIGFDWEKQDKLISIDENNYGFIEEKFHDLYNAAEKGEIEVKDFKVKAIDLLESSLANTSETKAS